MSNNSNALSVIFLSLAWLAPPAQILHADTPAAPVFIGHHYEGTITALNNVANTATITTKYGFKSLTVKVGPDTKIWKTIAARPEDVVVGDKVIVDGREGADKDSMQINVVDVVPDFPPKVQREKPKQHRQLLFGTVTAVAPSLTVTDLNNATVTLQTKDGRFNAIQTVAGDFADLAPGVEIDTEGDIDATGVLDARSIILNPDTLRPNPQKRQT